ncbi:hypothetical protein KDL29_14515 [bacterium]|nr:hypothetical protein [bacterium]
MTRLCLTVLACMLLLCGSAFAQQQQQGGQQQKLPDRTFGVHISGTLKVMDARGKEIEKREYICQRVCDPANNSFTEHYMSWIGMDTNSLREWEVSYELDGNEFTMAREDFYEGKGKLTGRAWSWDDIEYSYVDKDGLSVSLSGDFSGKNCQRAAVVLDKQGNVHRLIEDVSKVVTEEDYAIMQALYYRIKAGFN